MLMTGFLQILPRNSFKSTNSLSSVKKMQISHEKIEYDC